MKKMFNQIPFFKYEKESIVDELYFISKKSLPIAMLVALLGTILLYEPLGFKIILWCAVIFLVLIYRIYNAYQYEKFKDRCSIETWYNKFIISALLTAMIFGSISPLFLAKLDAYYQIFTVTIILGLSLGQRLHYILTSV